VHQARLSWISLSGEVASALGTPYEHIRPVAMQQPASLQSLRCPKLLWTTFSGLVRLSHASHRIPSPRKRAPDTQWTSAASITSSGRGSRENCSTSCERLSPLQGPSKCPSSVQLGKCNSTLPQWSKPSLVQMPRRLRIESVVNALPHH
jgi:hypothetical protein